MGLSPQVRFLVKMDLKFLDNIDEENRIADLDRYLSIQPPIQLSDSDNEVIISTSYITLSLFYRFTINQSWSS